MAWALRNGLALSPQQSLDQWMEDLFLRAYRKEMLLDTIASSHPLDLVPGYQFVMHQLSPRKHTHARWN